MPPENPDEPPHRAPPPPPLEPDYEVIEFANSQYTNTAKPSNHLFILLFVFCVYSIHFRSLMQYGKPDITANNGKIGE